MGNTAYYTAVRAWIAPYPQHWASSRGWRKVLLFLVLGRNSLDKAGSLGRQGLGAFLKHPAQEKLTALSCQSHTALQAACVLTGDLSSLHSAHQEKYLANLVVSFFSGFRVTRTDKPLIVPGRNNHKDFLKGVCNRDQAKLLVLLLAAVTALKVPQLHVFPMQSFCLNTPAIMIWLISAKWGSEYIHKNYHKNYINELSSCLPMF